jgi:hypothetical protein
MTAGSDPGYRRRLRSSAAGEGRGSQRRSRPGRDSVTAVPEGGHATLGPAHSAIDLLHRHSISFILMATSNQQSAMDNRCPARASGSRPVHPAGRRPHLDADPLHATPGSGAALLMRVDAILRTSRKRPPRAILGSSRSRCRPSPRREAELCRAPRPPGPGGSLPDCTSSA